MSTDIIVGFPGETEADFQDTLDLMKSVRFDSAFTFQYSKRTGTPAASMPDQITPDIVRERFSRLLELQNKHSLESNQALTGKSVEILIEGTSDTAADIYTGRTACNRLVNFSIPDLSILPCELPRNDSQINGYELEGRLAIVRLTLAKTFSIEGELEQLLP